MKFVRRPLKKKSKLPSGILNNRCDTKALSSVCRGEVAFSFHNKSNSWKDEIGPVLVLDEVLE